MLPTSHISNSLVMYLNILVLLINMTLIAALDGAGNLEGPRGRMARVFHTKGVLLHKD